MVSTADFKSQHTHQYRQGAAATCYPFPVDGGAPSITDSEAAATLADLGYYAPQGMAMGYPPHFFGYPPPMPGYGYGYYPPFGYPAYNPDLFHTASHATGSASPPPKRQRRQPAS